VLAAFVVLIMVAPGSTALTTTGASGSATPAKSLTAVAPTSPIHPTSPDHGIPGQNPAGEQRVSPSTLAKQLAKFPALDATRAAFKDKAPTPPAVAEPTLAPTAKKAGPEASTQNYGWITGTVVSSIPPYAPISGASVSAEPVTGFCPSVGCTPVETGATGEFTVAASIGENVVLVSDAYYLTNRTWAYVTTDGYVNVGTLELVEDGFVTGVLRGDDPAHEPIGGINVSSISRDGSIAASPSAHTDSSGLFTVAVPPVPSEVTFTPIFPFAPYESNITFVNVSSGQSISIGTVYLEKMTTVQISIVDAESGLPIDSGAAIQVCSRSTGYCPPQGPVGGSVLFAQAPVGPDVVQVMASGYVLNTTVLGVVPATRPGAPAVNMGTVDLVPGGGILLSVGVTGLPTARGQFDPTSLWPLGQYAVVSMCNLDGLSISEPTVTNMTSSECTISCVAPDAPSLISAIPLRDTITVEPDEIGCLFPGEPTWPIPEDMPVFDNNAWVNVTPDYVTVAGPINLLAGTYITGEVLPSYMTGWDVTACSTDETNFCGSGVLSDQAYDGNYRFAVPQGCTQPNSPGAAIDFCVPAPPGPVELRVTPANTSQNFTWAYNPPLTWDLWTGGPSGKLTPEAPLNLTLVDEDHSAEINLTSASVTGRVLQSRSLTPVLGLPSVEVCPAGVMPSGATCGNGVVNSTGFFTANAPFGWDVVTASAPQYQPNSTWIYVAHHNSTGTILIQPYGFVNGLVVNPDGVGVYEATIELCPVGTPTACTPVGADGLTSTDGAYYGATPAGPLPVGTYEVKASAPGYTTEWTWVNVTTPGQNFTAPTITLTPAVENPSHGGQPHAGDRLTASSSSSGNPGSWIVGRVFDAQVGIGLPVASIAAAPLTGGPPTVLSSIRGTGGEFNDSLPVGTYSLTFYLQGYYQYSTYLNVSGNASVMDLGGIPLVPFPTVTGRIAIDPAGWTANVTIGMGLGPGQATVVICTNEATICGPGGIVGTSGNFNASAPAGIYDLVDASGTGTGPGTAPAGFVLNETFVNVTNQSGSNSLESMLGLSIYGIITGSVLNANATSLANLPVRFDQITADSTFPVDQTQGEVFNATGVYAIIFPESHGLNLTAGGLGAWMPLGVGISPNGTGNSSLELNPGATLVLPPMYLEHYGSVDASIVDNTSGVGIPFAGVSASEKGTLWGLPDTFTASGTANGAGFVNLSAMPSVPAHQPLIKLSISAPDFQTANRTVEVNASETTFVNGTSSSHLKPVRLLSWGWVSGQVSDAVNGRLLPQVSVTVSENGIAAGKPGVVTNGLGLYRIDAPPSKNDTIALALGGYSTNRSIYNVTNGADIQAHPVHLTGDAVVAGQVVSVPGNIPVAGATVSVCPSAQPNCAQSVTTNSTGFFWMTAPPGLDAISASVAGYVANTSAFVKAVSDQWIWAGVISLQQYAYVIGTVIGLPDGLPLDGALASLCAPTPSGSGAGPCFTTVSTQPDGSFYLEAPAGSYVLDANATQYNDTYLSLALVPGETLPVGLIFVQQFGTATGAVFGQDTDQPAAGATVVACANWGTHVCGPVTATQSGGVYVINGRPGPYQLEASAPGYQTSYQAIDLTSGATVAVPTFLLVPIGPSGRYEVSGTVRELANAGLAVPGALVTANGGFPAPINAFGDFLMSLPWGNYTIAAEAPGFVTVSRVVDVTATVTGLNFLLPTQTYTVSGVLRDGLTNLPLGNVTILENGTPIATSTATGAYSLQLPNGTHDLVAERGSGYADLPFVVAIVGASQSVSLTLYPPQVAVDGLVVNGLTGLPLPSVAVKITGSTSDGPAWTANAVSSADGRFVVMTYPGTYTAVAQLDGYTPTQTAVVVNSTASAVPLTLPLPPLTTTGTSASSSAWVWAAIGGIAAAGVAAAVIVIARRARPPQVPARASSGGKPA
jgi:hypothetical protein